MCAQLILGLDSCNLPDVNGEVFQRARRTIREIGAVVC
uniref:Uncharacterized protein n=1 Tax=Anguilla anguilla TaxID=7936 RepID=A0A0E9UUB6_ANGAN